MSDALMQPYCAVLLPFRAHFLSPYLRKNFKKKRRPDRFMVQSPHKQKKPLDTVSPFPQGNGFSDSVSFHLHNSNGRPKKKDAKHDISSPKVPTQFIKKSRGRPRTTL